MDRKTIEKQIYNHYYDQLDLLIKNRIKFLNDNLSKNNKIENWNWLKGTVIREFERLKNCYIDTINDEFVENADFDWQAECFNATGIDPYTKLNSKIGALLILGKELYNEVYRND